MSNVEYQIVSEGYHLTLTGKLDVFETPSLLQMAREAIAAQKPIIMHIEGLEHVDASIFQVLLALQQEARRQGQSLQVIGAGPSIQQQGYLLGGDQSPFRGNS
jgi:anti-anti-sigma factor